MHKYYLSLLERRACGKAWAWVMSDDASTVDSFTAENLGIFDFKLTADELAQLNAV